MLEKLIHFMRRMKFMAMIEWERIIKNNPSDISIFLIDQRNLTKEEYAFPSDIEINMSDLISAVCKHDCQVNGICTECDVDLKAVTIP